MSANFKPADGVAARELTSDLWRDVTHRGLHGDTAGALLWGVVDVLVGPSLGLIGARTGHRPRRWWQRAWSCRDRRGPRLAAQGGGAPSEASAREEEESGREY